MTDREPVERVTAERLTAERLTAEVVAAEVVVALRERGLTLATAESLTGGGLGALVTSVPGASRVYVGGVVAYDSRVKGELLAVPAEVIESDGVVSERCAVAMAAGVRRLLRADVGVATTGVAGPGPQEGKPVGTVHVAVADASGAEARLLHLEGDRQAVRAATTRAALELVLSRSGGTAEEVCGAG